MKTNFRNELSGKTVLVIGIVFIVTGISLWGLTALNVQMRERTLYDPNLSLEERARVDGSLRWWRELGARLSYPLAAVLFVGFANNCFIGITPEGNRKEAEIQ